MWVKRLIIKYNYSIKLQNWDVFFKKGERGFRLKNKVTSNSSRDQSKCGLNHSCTTSRISCTSSSNLSNSRNGRWFNGHSNTFRCYDRGRSFSGGNNRSSRWNGSRSSRSNSCSGSVASSRSTTYELTNTPRNFVTVRLNTFSFGNKFIISTNNTETSSPWRDFIRTYYTLWDNCYCCSFFFFLVPVNMKK